MFVGVCGNKILSIMRSLGLIIFLFYFVSGENLYCVGANKNETAKQKSSCCRPTRDDKTNEPVTYSKTKEIGELDEEAKAKFEELRKIISRIEMELTKMNEQFSDYSSDEVDPITRPPITGPPTHPTWKPSHIFPRVDEDPMTPSLPTRKPYTRFTKKPSKSEKDADDLNAGYKNFAHCYLQGCCPCKDHFKTHGSPALTPVIKIYNYNNKEPSHVEDTGEEDYELATPRTEL